jgi:cell division protein FtsL
METTTNNRTWTPEYQTEDWQPDGWQTEDVSQVPLRPMSRSGIELNRLNRYGLMLAMLALCALLSTWSRIDLRSTSLALDEARSRYADAEAEQARLRLELASLSDPGWLAGAAATLSLESGAEVIHLSAPGARP